MAEARIHYHEELQHLEERALDGLDVVGGTLERTIEACQHQDIELAEAIVAEDDRIDERYVEVQQAILTLLATQAPVATDLRLIAALLHVGRAMERMGDQCVNVAKLIPLAGHTPPRRAEVVEKIVAMGRQVRAQLKQASRAFGQRDLELAWDLVRQDDRVDELYRECFGLALDIGDEHDLREWAMTMTMAARALERMGDYTVDIGEQIAFVVTGEIQEFEDASHPALAPPR